MNPTYPAMTRYGPAVVLLTLALLPGGAPAQQLVPTAGLASNEVRVVDAAGDSLWSGPLLTLYLEPEDRPRPQDSLLAADVPSLTEEENVVFALEAEQRRDGQAVVWAGLAFDAGEGTPGAGGFLVSTDAGQTFSRRAPALDAPDDTTVGYGRSTLSSVPVTQEVNAVPYDLALRADTVWLAGSRSGLRRSFDQGRSWDRVVLPPDNRRAITPDSSYDFTVGPPRENATGSQNHVVLSVLVDETGTVWAGTTAGVNRSRPQDEVPSAEGQAWRRFAAGRSPDRLTGNTVVALAEQPRPNARNPIWMASWPGNEPPPSQRFGITVTPDGGGTFRKALVGERIFDLATRETRIYAAGEQGLFVSDTQGRTWRTINDFRLQADAKFLPPDVTPRSVATTPEALWVGTSEGLLRLDRAQEPRLLAESPGAARPQWALLRTQVPVNPSSQQISEQVPDVATYAYPNPFVRSRDQLVRIVYELPEPRTVTVTIYDFGMNRVWSTTESKPSGQQETAWPGTDDQGLRVPTGTYFYTVDFGDQTVRGKILLTN